MAARKLAQKWKRMHAELREKFLSEVAAIPMAHRNARLAQLQRFYDAALTRRNEAHADMVELQRKLLPSMTKEKREEVEKAIRHARKIIEEQEDKARLILEQIAKEQGGALTNERHVHHSGSIGAEEPAQSIEELRNLIADRIAESFEKDPIKPNAPGTSTQQ